MALAKQFLENYEPAPVNDVYDGVKEMIGALSSQCLKRFNCTGRANVSTGCFEQSGRMSFLLG